MNPTKKNFKNPTTSNDPESSGAFTFYWHVNMDKVIWRRTAFILCAVLLLLEHKGHL